MFRLWNRCVQHAWLQALLQLASEAAGSMLQHTQPWHALHGPGCIMHAFRLPASGIRDSQQQIPAHAAMASPAWTLSMDRLLC